MKRGKHAKKRKISTGAILISLIILLTLTVGFVRQEKFLYAYSLNKLKNSTRIKDRINYSIAAAKHSSTEDDIELIKEILKKSQY